VEKYGTAGLRRIICPDCSGKLQKLEKVEEGKINKREIFKKYRF